MLSRLFTKKGHLVVPLFLLTPLHIRAESLERIFLPIPSIYASFYADGLITYKEFERMPYLKGFSVFGRGEVALGLSAIFGSMAILDKNDLSFAKRFFLACAISGITSVSLKYAFHRTRPNTGKNRFYGPGFTEKNVSFPSGHTQMAFVMAGILSERYKNPIFFYTLAFLVGASRIARNMHYLSDVVMGAYTGYMISKISFGKMPLPGIYMYSKDFKKDIKLIYIW